MESAELTKNNRIRHCYPRSEVYHTFVHDDEYFYSPANRHQVSSKGNYLVVGDIGRKANITDIEEMWSFNSDRMIAIIDRKLKRILINKTYNYHTWELERAVPNDYKIYYTNKRIPTKDILHNEEELLKLHCKYLITEDWMRNLYVFYRCLYVSNSVTLNQNIKLEFTEGSYAYRNFIKFIADNKINKYSWYKESFDENYELRIYTDGWHSITQKIKLPSIKQIVRGTVFKPKEKLYLEQKYFYTKICYGNGIPFSVVQKCWALRPTAESMVDWLKKYNIYFNTDWVKTQTLWREFVALAITADRNAYEKNLQSNIDKSNENHKKALEELDKLITEEYTVNDWREGKLPVKPQIKYRKYVIPRKRNAVGRWEDAFVTKHNFTQPFDNIQLKFSSKTDTIYTSNFANVPLSEGIKMYKLFIHFININPSVKNWTVSDFGNVKVGYYNLRFITYKEKETDFGKKLGYNQWIIQIGCHALWLDDILDFIKYYHLEEEFGIKSTTEDK